MNTDSFIKVSGREISDIAFTTYTILKDDMYQKMMIFEGLLETRLNEAKEIWEAEWATTFNYYKSGQYLKDLSDIVNRYKKRYTMREGFLWVKPIYRESINWVAFQDCAFGILDELIDKNPSFWKTCFVVRRTFYDHYSVDIKTRAEAIFHGANLDDLFPEAAPAPAPTDLINPYRFFGVPMNGLSYRALEILGSGYSIKVDPDEFPTYINVEFLEKYFNLPDNDCFIPINEYNKIIELKGLADTK